MVKKIFRSVFLSTIIVLLASVALIIASLNSCFISEQKKVLASETDLAAAGVRKEGEDYLKALHNEDYRITWINSDGTVLYDNEEDASSMGSHADREEVIEAFQNGTGSCERYSETLGQTTMYYAEKLPGNTVIRLAVTRNSLWLMLLRMITPFLWIIIAAVIASVLIAKTIARKIVEPLNHLNLDDPLSNRDIPEIEPLLERMDEQNHKIRDQVEELHQKQKEFNTVTNAIEEGLILCDQKENMISWNPAAAQLFGIDEEHHELPEEAGKLIHEAAQDRHVEKTLSLHDRKIQMNAGPVHSHGKQTGIAVLAVDVTETYEAEQMRREFTANVSHELKTPLQTIMGSSELLENHLVKDEDRDSFYTGIRSESSRMLTLIDDIIRLSQLDEDTPLEETDLSLKAVVSEAVEALREAAEKHGIQVETDLADVSVHASQRLVYEIAFNLIDNAIRYNRPDGQVKVTVERKEDHAVLKVADTGIGIPEKDLPRIYERFYRVDKSHSRATGGTGLGLSIVKHAVKKCRAVIRVQSEVNRGTVFTVLF